MLLFFIMLFYTLLWRHNGRDGVSNHLPQNCWLCRSFRRRWKKPHFLCGELIGDQWIIRTNGQQRGKCFHLLMSSWYQASITASEYIQTHPDGYALGQHFCYSLCSSQTLHFINIFQGCFTIASVPKLKAIGNTLRESQGPVSLRLQIS